MNIKTTIAAAVVAAAPFAAHSAQISMDSQLELTGLIDRANSEFTPTGQVDFEEQLGTSPLAIGDFSSIVTEFEALDSPEDPTEFTLTDIDFSAPGQIWAGGGFSFTATSFGDFDSDFPGRSFVARGTISSDMFDDTPGIFALSTQSTGDEVVVSFSSSTTPVPVPAAGLLLLGGLGGLAALRRRK